jgi:hypothetical protein
MFSAYDLVVIPGLYIFTTYRRLHLTEHISLTDHLLYLAECFSPLVVRTLWTGRFVFSLWVITHECDHQANNSIGCVHICICNLQCT